MQIPQLETPSEKEIITHIYPRFAVLLGACQEWDCLSCWTLHPCVQSCAVTSSASWLTPVDALVSTELRKITCKHSRRKTLVVGSCVGEERPAHGDSWEWWDGEPHPALDPGLFLGLQGLSTMLLSDLLAAHAQLTIYFPMSSSLSCRMKHLSPFSTSVQAFHQQWACSQLKTLWLFLQRNLAEQQWVQVRHREKWEASWLIPWHWLFPSFQPLPVLSKRPSQAGGSQSGMPLPGQKL